MTETDATNVVGTFRGLARRLVAASSQDVYQAWGYVLGTDTGPVDPLITEESPLRQSRFPYRNRRLPAFREWDIDNYDKVLVEQALRSEPSLPVTLLRLPMVYGPGDYARRTYAWAKRMDDGRSVIPLEKPLARWHGPMGYVEDVASAFALAVVNDAARGRTYNVAESDVRSTAQFIRDIGAAMNWEGHVVELPPGSMPGPWTSYRLDQDVITDSTCIRQELGYRESVPRLTAMRQAVQWELAHPPHPLPAELFNYAAEDQVLAKLDVSAGGGAL